MATKPRIDFIGNLGGDPDFRTTPQGVPVASFSVANTPSIPDGNGGFSDGDTTWFRVTLWRQNAVAANSSLRKGDKVRVEGRFSINEYTTKNGEARISYDVDAESVTKVLRAEKDTSVEDDPWHT